MSRRVHVVGVGMTPFSRPGMGEPYPETGAAAVRAALGDAGLDYAAVEQVYASHVYCESGAGQAVVYGVGLTGVPVFNVDNTCASGSTALFLARQAVSVGAVECALAVGFEQMAPGPLPSASPDRPSPLDRFDAAMAQYQGLDPRVNRTAQLFAGAARDYLREHGIRTDTLGRIAVKARQHAARNPRAVFRQPVTLDEVMESPMVFDPLTRLQCCPPTCGAAAVVVCSPEFARRHDLDRRVTIAAQAMVTDTAASFEPPDMRRLAGGEMTRAAAARVYDAAGIGPEDLDLVELHDCFTINELISYEALGLVPAGGAEKFILDGDNTYGGRIVTNPSGGLLGKGHPLGATGLAQCAELTWQLRGQADQRQVEGARLALQHNLGLGGACVVTLYQAA